jgi:predicted MPP superfamily phosphohydrolase
MVVIAGDVVAYWRPELPRLVGNILEPLLLMNGNVVAIPGNHEYDCGSPEILGLILGELNVRLLRNEAWRHEGITWVGIDSASMGMDDAHEAMFGIESPAICIWHEPDMVDRLPEGCSLMLSGHSHGGQFVFPGGFTPMHTNLGRRFVKGYFKDAPTPLYVSRGIGTTGPPSRLNCAPEVALLTLIPG